MNYAAIAAERWPLAVIMGVDGRYAVVGQNGGVVYLAMTESQQKNIALGIEGAVKVDLKPCPVPNIRETAEDRYEERLRAKRGL